MCLKSGEHACKQYHNIRCSRQILQISTIPKLRRLTPISNPQKHFLRIIDKNEARNPTTRLDLPMKIKFTTLIVFIVFTVS